MEISARGGVSSYRYLLKADFQDSWQEVSKEVWIKAERAAGFRPKLWSGTTCATGGFSGGGVCGRLERKEVS